MKIKKLILSILLTCITICAAGTMAACNKDKVVTYTGCQGVIVLSSQGDILWTYESSFGAGVTVSMDFKNHTITIITPSIWSSPSEHSTIYYGLDNDNKYIICATSNEYEQYLERYSIVT